MVKGALESLFLPDEPPFFGTDLCKARVVVNVRVTEGRAKIYKNSTFSGKISSLINSKHPTKVYFM